MAVILASTRCTLWCPDCGKVTSITCYRHPEITTGRHANCVIGLRAFLEEPRKLEEYYGFQFEVYGQASLDEREVS
jgi:hypothetical protein